MKTLEENEVRYMRTKTFDRKKNRQINFLSSSNSFLRHQKRETSSQQLKQQLKHQHQQFQQSAQLKHQHENQSDKQSKQQRQQNKKQRQHIEQFQRIQSRQFQMQPFERYQSFDSILFTASSVSSKFHVLKASKSHDRVLFNLIKIYSNDKI